LEEPIEWVRTRNYRLIKKGRGRLTNGSQESLVQRKTLGTNQDPRKRDGRKFQWGKEYLNKQKEPLKIGVKGSGPTSDKKR